MSELIPEDHNELNDDVVIKFTQKVRKKLVDVIIQDGMPVTTDDRAQLLTALDGLSKTAIQNKRLGVEEASNENTKAAQLAVSKLLGAFGEMNPFLKTIPTVNSAPTPALDQLPVVEVVPGEVEVGVQQNNFNTFIAERTALEEK